LQNSIGPIALGDVAFSDRISIRVGPFLGIAIFATKLMGISFGAQPEHRFRRMPRKRFATKSARSGTGIIDQQ
jgi:hypothetical protein